MGRIIYQVKENDCGICALKNLMFLIYKTSKVFNLYYKNNCHNFYQIIDCAADYGVYLKGYEIDDKMLLNIKKPFIAAIYFNDKEHFVVCEKISGRKITVIDSLIGKRKMNIDEFKKIFRYRILEVANVVKKKIRRIHLFSRKEVINIIAISFIELALSFLTLLFIDKRNIVLLIASGAFLIGIYIVKKLLSIRILENIDKRFILPYFLKEKDRVELHNLIEIKINCFKSVMNFCTHLQVIIIIFYFMLTINILYGFSLLIDLGVVTISYLCFKPKKNAAFRKVLIAENFVSSNNEDIFFSNYKKAQKTGKKYMLLDSLSKYLPLVISLGLNFLNIRLISSFDSFDLLMFIIYNCSVILMLNQLLSDEESIKDSFIEIGRLNVCSRLPLIDKYSLLGYNLNT